MQNHCKKRAVWFGIAAAGWLGVLFFFSGQSGTDSGNLSAWLTRFLFGWLIDLGVDAGLLEFLLRKCAHAGIFAIEGFLLGMSLLSGMKKRSEAFFLTVAGCAMVAIANELHQLTAQGRSCNITDMAIDTAGALAGLLAARILLYLLGLRTKKSYDR